MRSLQACLLRLGAVAIRHRYLLLVLWSVPWFVLGNHHRASGLDDWLDFEFGARALIHYNSHYRGGGLGLYASYPFIQIGPPALIVVAAVQWLPHNAVGVGFGLLMAFGGVWAVRSAETTARALLPDRSARHTATMALAAGVPATVVWSYEAGVWRHIDDAMAICFLLAATALVARQRWWLVAGMLVGLGVSAKPWALILAPVLLGLTRAERPKAALAALATAAACWAPFVLGGPGTLKGLGSYRLVVNNTSTLHLLGVSSLMAPTWVRPLQMAGGFVVMAILARRSHWVAVPFAGLAFRVVTDPQVWLYYGLGPLMAAVLWDSLHERRWPVWTMATLVAEFVVPTVAPGSASVVRLVWAVAVLVSCARFGRSATIPREPEGSLQPAPMLELQPAH
jgi:hypothetical protein